MRKQAPLSFFVVAQNKGNDADYQEQNKGNDMMIIKNKGNDAVVEAMV